MTAIELFSLDLLPGMSAVVAEFDDTGTRLRFTATNAEGRQSLPSGWFNLADAPIMLTWYAFDFGDEQ